LREGYRIHYFGEGIDGATGLPDHLFCDGTLDEGLIAIKEFLRTWVKSSGSNGPPDGQLRHLNISVIGPFPEDLCVVDRRTPEQQLADADSPEERFWTLGHAAKSCFDGGRFEEAARHIAELREMLPSFKDDWHYHDAFAAVHIVSGRLALREGNVEDAKKHLMEAGRSDGSPVMSSFGPNMSLAHDLLLAGERQAVLDYFKACSEFWEDKSDELEEWAMYVNAGRMPDFGGNLSY